MSRIENINEYLGSEDDAIVLDFISGMTYQALGLKYNKTPKAVDSYLRRRRVTHKDIHIEDVLADIRSGMTFDVIGKKYNVNRSHISKLLKKHNIDPLIWQKLVAEGKSGRRLDLQEIKRLYEIEGRSCKYISGIYGFVGDGVIRQLLKDDKVNLRVDGIHQLKANDKFLARSLLDDEAYLRNLYITEGKSAEEIGNIIGVSQHPVLAALHRLKIPIKVSLQYQNRRTIGSYHKQIIEFLDQNNIRHQTCYIHHASWNLRNKYWEIDEYLPEHKLFIEIQGEHWHGIIERSRRYASVRSKMWSDLWKYLTLKRDLPDHNILYLTDVNNNILRLSKVLKLKVSWSNTQLDIDKVTIKPVDNSAAKRFLEANHYLGYVSGSQYGAYIDGRLSLLCTMSNPTRQNIKSSIGTCRELRRLAVADNVPANIISYALSRIHKLEYKLGTRSIVTFADPTPWRKTQHSGAIYKACNYTYVGQSAWSYCYLAEDNSILHKKTVYNRAKALNQTEAEFMLSNKMHKLPEWPKLKFEILLRG